MSNLLNEIRQFRRFTKLNESLETINTVMFGDELIYYLFDKDIEIIKDLTRKRMTINELLVDAEFREPDLTVDHVFFSIGTDDKFKNSDMIPQLCDVIKNIFPESKIYVIRAILDDDYFYSEQEDKVIENLELEIDNYYKIFEKNGIDIIGDYNSVEYGLGITKQKLDTIKNSIAKKIIDDISGFNKKVSSIENEPFVVKSNVIIKGNDETDFDTIYEFLERFEEMVKSGNEYSRRSNSSHKLDVEQIQITLNFLKDENLVINGKYDLPTENLVMDYQFSKGLERTGVCDSETLEEMYYDLKIKGFDEDDLALYLSQLGFAIKLASDYKRYEGGVDGVWVKFTDKIIDKFEGGYWNNDMTKPVTEKCINHPFKTDFSEGSGETMFGIDRRAGGWDNVEQGREYFGLIDQEKEDAGNMIEFCKKWKYGYRGGSLEPELKRRAGELMRVSYERNKKYFTSEALYEVEGSKRLLFHFAYACWNGSGFFQDFANDINRAVAQGMTGDELVDVAVEGRNRKFGSGNWSRANQTVTNIIKNDPELEN
jgi:hypothetical protein